MAVRITLQTVADRVGVSRATVSNAYNRPDQLSSTLRERILTTANELGYRGPDAAARSLRTGQMGTIGLLFTEDLRYVFNDPNTTEFMRGVAETSALARTGLTLLPVPVGVDPAATAVASVAADGHLVFSVAEGHPALEILLGRGRPIVIVDQPYLDAATSFVGIDDRAGARLAATHLIELGHRRIGVLLGRVVDMVGSVPPSRAAEITVRVVRERLAGCRDAMVDAQLDPDDLVLWASGGNDPDDGRVAATAMLGRHSELTGLVCFSDQLAIGATQAALRLGRSVPNGLSIVGFDDVPCAASWEPPLTTIRQPLVDKGRVAADLLLELIAGGTPRRIELPIELVVRSSTAPTSG